VTYCYLAGLGTLLQGRTKVVLREFTTHRGRRILGHDEGLDGLKQPEDEINEHHRCIDIKKKMRTSTKSVGSAG